MVEDLGPTVELRPSERLQVAEGEPLSVADGTLTLDLDKGTCRLPLSKIHAVAVGAIREDIRTVELRVRGLVEDGRPIPWEVVRRDAERAVIWKGRKSAFSAVGRLSPDYIVQDGVVPRTKLGEALAEIERLSGQYDIRVANVFHAGDGNLHPLILYDSSRPDEVAAAERLGAQILELSVAVGGCITGEHGVGLEKLAQMPAQFTEAELRQFERIKEAFDPGLALNPGKGIPLLKHCQEYRSLEQGRTDA